MPNSFIIGCTIKDYLSTFLACHSSFLSALDSLRTRSQLAGIFSFPQETVQAVHALAMYYLQLYFFAYRPEPEQCIRDPTDFALLQVATISLALKVQF